MHRYLRLWALLAVLTMALAACGGSDEGTTEPEAEALSGSIDVWIMDPGSPELQQFHQGLADDFEAKNAGTTVNIEFVPWGNVNQRITTALAGQETPDVTEMGTTLTARYAELGALEPLELTNAGDYVSSLVEAGTFDGKVYGKPWYAGARGLLYNKELLDAAGVEPPDTWEDVDAICETMKQETPDVFCFGADPGSQHAFLPTIWQAGGDIAVQEGDTWKSTMDSPEAIEAWKWWSHFYTEGFLPEGALEWTEGAGGTRTNFQNEKVAMIVAGPWDYAALTAAKPDLEGKLASSLLPAGPSGDRSSFAGGSLLSVFRGTDNRALAEAFIDYMLQPENVTAFVEQINFLPGTVAGIDAMGWDSDPVLAPFAEQLKSNSRTYPSHPKWGAFEQANIFVNGMQDIFRGEATVEEALTKIAETMNKEFAT